MFSHSHFLKIKKKEYNFEKTRFLLFYINVDKRKEKYALGLVKLEILDRLLHYDYSFIYCSSCLVTKWSIKTVTLTLIRYTNTRIQTKEHLSIWKKTSIWIKCFQNRSNKSTFQKDNKSIDGERNCSLGF